MCAGIIASAPVYWHFFFSQCQLLIGAMILIAYTCLRNGRPVAACLAITTVACLKLFPAVLVPWFLWRASRDWTVHWRCAGAAMVWSAGLLVASGLEHWRQFWTLAWNVIETWIVWQRHFNFTAPSFVKNAAWSLHGFDSEWNGLHVWAKAGTVIGIALIAVSYGICWWSGGGKKDTDIESEFCLLSIARLAGIAEGWGHYFVMLGFPVAVAAARMVQRPATGWVAVLGISLVMLNLMGSWRSPWLEFAVSYVPFHGLLLLGTYFVNETLSSKLRTADLTTSVPPPS